MGEAMAKATMPSNQTKGHGLQFYLWGSNISKIKILQRFIKLQEINCDKGKVEALLFKFKRSVEGIEELKKMLKNVLELEGVGTGNY